MSLKVITSAIAVVLCAGCVGNPSDRVAPVQPADESLSCEGLTTERALMLEQAALRDAGQLNTTSGNVFLAGVGAALPPTLLFINPNGAEAAEARAFRIRANSLAGVIESRCGVKLERVDEGRDPYQEEADRAFARGETAATL